MPLPRPNRIAPETVELIMRVFTPLSVPTGHNDTNVGAALDAVDGSSAGIAMCHIAVF